MRLTEIQQAAIRSTVAETFGDGANVWLFGSRVDDTQRGGDIDLLIETDQTDPRLVADAELHFLTKLNRRIGEQKIDVLVDYPVRQWRPPIFSIAKRTGIRL
ncbi:NTP_transf_2 domain-containing protein [Gammaproteobacteria bacterium]